MRVFFLYSLFYKLNSYKYNTYYKKKMDIKRQSLDNLMGLPMVYIPTV